MPSNRTSCGLILAPKLTRAPLIDSREGRSEPWKYFCLSVNVDRHTVDARRILPSNYIMDASSAVRAVDES